MRSQGLKTQNQLIAPSVNGKWPLDDIIATGIFTEFASGIGILSVEKCVERTGSLHQFSEAVC